MNPANFPLTKMNHQPQDCNEMTPVAACSFFSLTVSGYWKRKIPARLQGLQIAFQFCRNQKEIVMSEYRFHLQKYRPGSKTICPECGRKACFTRYIDGEGVISFPDNVASATTSTVVATIIRPKSIFTTIRPLKRH